MNGAGRRNMSMAGRRPRDMKGALRRTLGYLKGYGWIAALVAVLLLVSTVCTLMASYMLFPIVNRLAGIPCTPESAGRLAYEADRLLGGAADIFRPFLMNHMRSAGSADAVIYLSSAVIVLLSVYLIGIISTWAEQKMLLYMSQHALSRMRRDLFESLQNKPVGYFDSHSTGEIMSRFTNDIDAVGTMFSTSLLNIVSGLVTLVGTFIFMLTTSGILTLVTVLFSPVYLFGGLVLAKKSRKAFLEQQKALGRLNGQIEESVSGERVIKAFTHENAAISEFSKMNDSLMSAQVRAQFLGGLMAPVMGSLSRIAYAVTIGIGGIMMFTSRFTPGALTVFAQYAQKFSFPINSMAQQVTQIFASLAGAERVFSAMDEKNEDRRGRKGRGRIRGDIEFRHVSFGYVPERRILDDISLKAEKGKKIAFVGSTGAGKTTIISLLERFYDIDEGEILIDGIPIEEWNIDELRRNMALVLQDTHLITGTVMDNIRYGRPDATDEEVREAAVKASAESFILRLENGYDTMLGEDGANLSEGERQLISIARAAVTTSAVLILDEATSSVDTRTEKHIEEGLMSLMKERTVFMIAHRLSTVRNADEIIVLEHGRIIERGTHEQLMKLGGRYHELATGKQELQ